VRERPLRAFQNLLQIKILVEAHLLTERMNAAVLLPAPFAFGYDVSA
jgi:hypothetical protein